MHSLAIVLLIIGIGLLILSLFLDGILDNLLFDGAIPITSVFLIMSSLTIILANNSQLPYGISITIASIIIGFISSLITAIFYKSLKKHGELKINNEIDYTSILHKKAPVIFWKNNKGQIIVNLNEKPTRVNALQQDNSILIKTGDNVIPIEYHDETKTYTIIKE